MDNTASELAKVLGSHGGKTTSRKHGKEHYLRLAKHMNEVRAAKKKQKLASK